MAKYVVLTEQSVSKLQRTIDKVRSLENPRKRFPDDGPPDFCTHRIRYARLVLDDYTDVDTYPSPCEVQAVAYPAVELSFDMDDSTWGCIAKHNASPIADSADENAATRIYIVQWRGGFLYRKSVVPFYFGGGRLLTDVDSVLLRGALDADLEIGGFAHCTVTYDEGEEQTVSILVGASPLQQETIPSGTRVQVEWLHSGMVGPSDNGEVGSWRVHHWECY